MRVSIESGSFRVTTTRGFFLTDMSCSHEIVQTSLTGLAETTNVAGTWRFLETVKPPSTFASFAFRRVLAACVPSSVAEGRAKTRSHDGNRGKPPSGRRPTGELGSAESCAPWCDRSVGAANIWVGFESDGVVAFSCVGGARLCSLCRDRHGGFGQGFDAHDLGPAGAALCQPEVRPRQRSRRPDQGQRRRLGLYALGPAGRDHSRI